MSYPGGKNGSGVYQALINLMPPHETYIEPFLGGGAIMRIKRPARVNIGVDLEEAAIESPMLPASSSDSPPSAETGKAADAHRRRTAKPPVEASSGESGAAVLHGGNAAPVPRFEYRNECGIEFLEYRQAGQLFTGRELVYCDPPYLMSTRSGRQLYTHELPELEHRRLLRVLRKLPCMVMISGYSSVLYAKELKDWNAVSFPATTRGGTQRAEWVWFNFPRPTFLHDYRFLGSDFRERQDLKRQTSRWIARLRRMPQLKRQALLGAISAELGESAAPGSVDKR